MPFAGHGSIAAPIPARQNAITALDDLTGGLKVERVSLFHDSCELACGHCGWRGHTAGNTGDNSTAAWLATLRWCKRRGVKSVIFTGGEISARDDFLQIVVESLWLGFDITIETHGRRYRDPTYCAQFSPGSRLNYIVSLHGADAAVHDTITRVPGSFEDTVRGISNLAGLTKSEVNVITVVSATNVSQLTAIHDLCGKLGVKGHHVALMILRGWGTAQQLPDLAQLKNSVTELIDRAAAAGPALHLNNMPFCLDPRLRKLSLNYTPTAAKGEFELMHHPASPGRSFIARLALPSPLHFPKPCRRCFFHDLCPGSAFVDKFGSLEGIIEPIPLN
ncbi:radical SAM protein [uncultured Bradyrhizobium sp.]|uniref:radical SAM protein n=1 Tax=uncultured Bradyrhizobium sp. TaxID=199684 RepID=UPI0035CBAFC9